MKQEDIDEILDTRWENVVIDCLSYTGKQLNFFVINLIESVSHNILTQNKRQFIIKNANILNNNVLDVIFSNQRKLIYLINISYKQEKYIYNKYKRKYRYYKCKFEANKDSFMLYLKRLIFLKDNRMDLMKIGKAENIRYILKFISYNLPYTTLEDGELLENLELLMELDKYSFIINKDNILKVLLNSFIVPTFGYTVEFPPKVKIDKKSKKQKELTSNEVYEKAIKTMSGYFKNREKIFIKRNEDLGEGLI